MGGCYLDMQYGCADVLPGRCHHQCNAAYWFRTQPMHSCAVNMRLLLKNAQRCLRLTSEVCLHIRMESIISYFALPVQTLTLTWFEYTFAIQHHQCLCGVKSGDFIQVLEKEGLEVLEKEVLEVLEKGSRKEPLPLCSCFTFLITSNHFLLSVSCLPEESSPDPVFTVTLHMTAHRFPNGAGYQGYLQIQKHSPLPHHDYPPFTPSPGIFFSFTSSCHLTLTDLLLRCLSPISLSWSGIQIHYTAKERLIFNFQLCVSSRDIGSLKVQIMLWLPLLPSLNHFI